MALPGLVSLSNATAVSTGFVLDGQVAYSNHVMVITANGTCTGGQVQLRGSVDGVNYYALGGPVPITTSNAVYPPLVISDQANRFLRADVVSPILGGGSVTVSVAMSSSV